MQTIRFSFANKVRVVLIGPDQNRLEHVPELATLYGADPDKICLVKAPSNQEGEGYQVIVPASYGKMARVREPDVYAEGVILTEEKSGAVIRTADCPTLVLFEMQSGRVVVTHAGRAALTPSNQPGQPINNIVTTAYDLVAGTEANPYVLAYITGSICPHCFPHEGEAGKVFTEPFAPFGEVAFADRARGELDLPSLISYQLTALGVRQSRIWLDNICTYETPGLASYRRDRSDARNAVIVVKH